MKNCSYSLLPKGIDKGGTLVQVGQQEIIHMRVVHATRRNDRSPDLPLFFQKLEISVVDVPDIEAALRDCIRLFYLSPEKGSDEFTGKIG